MTDEQRERMLYFGCIGSPGHYLFNRQTYLTRREQEDLPNSARAGALDGTLLDKRAPQIQGRAVLVHRDGWTFLAFWDRSVDRRPGSNSVFLAPGTHDFATMLEGAKASYPFVCGRFAFGVVPADVVETERNER